MTLAHRIQVVLSEDGKLLLDQLPFKAGENVEIIILPVSQPNPLGEALRGTVLRYDQPTEPVAEADWGNTAVIILDTHVWVWWVDGGAQLPSDYLALIQAEAPNGLGVCAISCWEVAKLVELGRLQLTIAVQQWLSLALLPPAQLLPLTPEIAVGSTQLPGVFHRDPADQMIVATARHYSYRLVTLDRLIRAYPHVQLAP